MVDAARSEDEGANVLAAASVDSLADTIVVQTPTAMSGIRAKARAAVLVWAGPLSDYSDEDERPAIARNLLTELAGMADGASIVTFDPERRVARMGEAKDWR